MRKGPTDHRAFPSIRSRVLTCLIVAGILAVIARPASAAPGKSNLLVITIDTLRADRVGAYGNKGARTPAMDGLARRGVLFSRTFSHVPLTLPSHCTLFTGFLPLTHGVRDNGERLRSTPVTLAEIARGQGYATAAIVGAFPLDSRFGLDRGFDTYDDFYGSRNRVQDMAFVERRAAEVNRKAEEWIRAHNREPFFVWVHYFDPHAPYDPPPPFDREFAGREYDGEIAYADECLGKLLAVLRDSGRADDTMVVLTSDHGEGLGAHEEKTHGIFIYDPTLHVPLIIAGPGPLPRGRIVDAQVGLADILPTVLDLMGWPLQKDLPGRSLVPMMTRQGAGREDFERALYIESMAPLLGRNWAPLRGVRTSEWKYIDAPTAELYDLKADPGEAVNIHDSRPEIVRRFRGEMEAIIKQQPAPPFETAPNPHVDREARQKLQSLGYLSHGVAPATTPRPDPKTMIGLDNLLSDAVNASETGRLEEAAAIYKDILRRQPDYIIGYDYAAYNLTKMGRGGEAVRLLEDAVGRGLGTDQLLAHLGLYYQEAGRLDESIRTLEKALALNQFVAEAHNDLGVSLFKSGRVDEAVGAFRQSLALDSNYAMAMNNLGNCYLARKSYPEAAEQYRAAIAVDDRLASAHNGLAAVYYRQGRVAEAEALWEKSVEIEPRQTEALYNLGRAYLRMGRKKDALRLFELFVQYASPQQDDKDIEEVKDVIERLKKERHES
ncbi:MAG: sulfatase-like hydrolase/transferase [Candidatus Aminicenantes bacterium]|nr:sulfatase-like hydrolase/transferase [Candidatus Aminicenantes bacterium]